MDSLRVLWSRLRATLFASRDNRDIADDIEAHLDLLAEDFQARGMTPVEARLAARRTFGSVDSTTEAYRDRRRFRAVEVVVQDLRHAGRHLAGAPWFSAAVVATLAAGMGIALLVFGILNAMNLRPAPFERPGDLYVLTTRDARGRDGAVSYPDYLDWRNGLTSFSKVAAFTRSAMNLGGEGQPTERVEGTYLSAHTFDLLGTRPLLGRTLVASDDEPGAPAVVVIAHGVWQGRFAGATDIVGRTVRVNGTPATVVGVMPEGFAFPLTGSIWQPIGLLPGVFQDTRDARRLSVVARMAPGTTPATAGAELQALAQAMGEAHPGTNSDIRAAAIPFQERYLGRVDQGPPLLLIVAAALVLLIACATAAGLLAARASFRAPEMALRAALGGSRTRLLAQLVTESLVLATIAGVAGLAIAGAGLKLFASQTTDLGLPPWTVFTIDATVATAAVGLILVVTLLFGVAPAWRISGLTDPRLPDDASRSGRRTSAMTRPLVVLQTALSVLVLAGTWTIAGYATRLAVRDDVIDASAIWVGRLALDATAYPTPERRAAYYDALRARLAGHPALAAVTIATAPPFAFADLRPLTVDGAEGSDTERVFVVGIDRSYFETIGLPVVRGRRLEPGDEQVNAQSVVVNERFVARFFGVSDPLSRRIRLGANRYGDPATDWLTVVGVSASVRQAPIQDLQPVVYVPLPSERRTEAFVLAKAAPGAAIGPVLREAVAAVDADVPLYNLTSLDHISRMSRWTPRIFSAGLSVVGLVALLLSTCGAYAVAAYAASRRLKEVGVRIALGAAPWDVVRALAASSAITLLVGLCVGIAGTVALTQLLGALLVEAGSGSALSILFVPVVITAGVSLAAVLLPAFRATRVDPILVLRRD
jgi:putative ABC transport system permease protein